MILKTNKSKEIIIIVVLMITITTMITYYVMVNNSTAVPKSATLVQIELIGGDFYG